MPFVEYVNPACTGDIILERNVYKDRPEVLLIERGSCPFVGKWAFPGGHMNLGTETVENCVVRELKEETGLVVLEKDLRLFGVYSEPKRDPRGHYVTHVYTAESFEGQLEANDDASDAKWFFLDDLPELAFDHEKIINDYIAKNKYIWKGMKK